MTQSTNPTVSGNDFTTLNSHFKEVYSDNIQDLRPDGVDLLNNIPFLPSDKQNGSFYNQPITLSHEAGFSYGGSGGSAFALSGAVQISSQNAQIQGTEIVLQSYLSVAAASRSQNSKAAFVSETKYLVENMLKSMARRLEVTLINGQANIGVVETNTAGVLKIEDQEWASGIWSGSEGMVISSFTAAGVFVEDMVVTSVNLESKEVTVTGATSSAATDVIFFKSARVSASVYNEFAGLHKIITNTGVLFNIDASLYNLWKGNVVNVGASAGAPAVMSFDKVESGIAKAMSKGLHKEDVSLLCSPTAWSQMIVEQAAKRSYDSSYSSEKFEQGAKSIRFNSANGMIEVVSSIYVKEGYAYMCPMKEFVRIGSSDITFEQPGFEGKFLKILENFNGYEMRCYTDQALFTAKPGLCVMFQYIASSVTLP